MEDRLTNYITISRDRYEELLEKELRLDIVAREIKENEFFRMDNVLRLLKPNNDCCYTCLDEEDDLK